MPNMVDWRLFLLLLRQHTSKCLVSQTILLPIVLVAVTGGFQFFTSNLALDWITVFPYIATAGIVMGFLVG